VIKVIEIIAIFNELVQKRSDFFPVDSFIDDKALSGFQ
jgi:hypothetical protein